MSRTERRELPEEVVVAARKMFLHFGVGRTTMADISREVGMPRQTLYEYVSSRNDLVEVVLVRRISEISDVLKSLVKSSFSDSFVDTALAAIRTARDDHELMNIVATAPKDVVQRVIVGRCDRIHKVVSNLFGPILAQGIQSGDLRTDKSPDQIVDWFRIVFLALIRQADLTPEEEHSFVADFLLASVLSPHAPPK